MAADAGDCEEVSGVKSIFPLQDFAGMLQSIIVWTFFVKQKGIMPDVTGRDVGRTREWLIFLTFC